MRKPVFRILTRSDTNWDLQLQKMARGLKFQISEEEGLYYLCRESKGAGQQHSYCAADMRFCFCLCKNSFSHDAAHIMTNGTI